MLWIQTNLDNTLIWMHTQHTRTHTSACMHANTSMHVDLHCIDTLMNSPGRWIPTIFYIQAPAPRQLPTTSVTPQYHTHHLPTVQLSQDYSLSLQSCPSTTTHSPTLARQIPISVSITTHHLHYSPTLASSLKKIIRYIASVHDQLWQSLRLHMIDTIDDLRSIGFK